jgi:shikimate kinase
LKIENDVLADLNVHNSVISTGGSAIFGKSAMEHLKNVSTVVYIKVPFDILEKRLKNLKRRGVVLEEGQTLKDVFDLRSPLYEKYADIVIEAEDDMDIQDTAMKIAELFEK